MDINEEECNNVLSYFISKSREADEPRKILEALDMYIGLLREGRRLPASEPEVWLAGYPFRKQHGLLTENDRNRMRQMRSMDDQKFLSLLFITLVGFIGTLVVNFVFHAAKIYVFGLFLACLVAAIVTIVERRRYKTWKLAGLYRALDARYYPPEQSCGI